MPSVINLQFNSVPSDGEFVKIKNGYVSNDLNETFKTLRTASFQSTIVPANITATRNEFINAFNADYNSSNLFTVTSSGSDGVAIEHPEDGFFTNGEFVDGTSGAVTIDFIDDTPGVTPINITDVSFSQSLVSACDNSLQTVTTSDDVIEVKINGVVIKSADRNELVTNGGFDGSVGWSLGNGWSISSGEAHRVSDPSNTNLTPTIPAVAAGAFFIFTVEITSYTSGGLKVRVQGGAEVNIPDTVGVHKVNVISGSSGSSRLRTRSSTSVLSIDNVSIKEVLPNPFTFEHVRGAFINLEVESAEGQTDSLDIQLPSTLSASNVAVSVVNSPSGATVTAAVTNTIRLDLEYSLDDITYQASNTFSSITEGSYTFYIKDQLGCNAQVPFIVEAFEDGGVGVQFPIADLPSKSLSIRFAKVVDWGICTDYKNDENTLSCELAFTQNPRHINQLFQECDIITTQIRSNYDSIAATVIQEDGTETLIPVDQKSDNIGLKDKRDSIKYDLGNGQTGIYFTSGNTYDFDTDIINGTYALNGGLPQFGTIGNFVLLDVSWFQIIDILFDERKNAEVLVIDDNYTGVDVSVIVGSIYNAQDYDIYEFTINMGSYPNQKIQVNITETDADPNFPDVTFLSEIIDIKESHPKTVDITYFNDVNTDIFYSTGIINKIRIPIEYYVGGFSGDTEAERTDVNTILINAEIYENDEFHFDLLSKQIMRKVVQALSHKFVTIDEVAYVKEDDPTSTPLVGTNLYRLIAVMTKADSVYTSQGTGVEFVAATIEVPNLIQATADGFIRWK